MHYSSSRSSKRHIRSFLFVPAVKRHFYQSILSLTGRSKPDCIIFDLEDSVASSHKAAARDLAEEFLNVDSDYRKKISQFTIRINESESDWFYDDLKLVEKVRPDFVVLPKVQNQKVLHEVRRIIPGINIIAILETLEGLNNIDDVLEGLFTQDFLAIGYEDLSAELCIVRPQHLNLTNPLTHVLMDILIKSRLKGVNVIDSVSRKYKTEQALEEFRQECQFTRSLGMMSKLAIHPNQIDIIHSVFDYYALINEAKEMSDLFNKLKDGSAVAVDDNLEMVDTPSKRWADKVLALYGA